MLPRVEGVETRLELLLVTKREFIHSVPLSDQAPDIIYSEQQQTLVYLARARNTPRRS